MKIKLFKRYKVDPMINSWHYHLPHTKVYGLFLVLPFKVSVLVLTLKYWFNGFNMFSNEELKILRFRVMG